MDILAVIPARYSSTRLAGKVLTKETGKFLIQHTYEQVRRAKLPKKVIIAADDEKIVAAAQTFGADCVLTSVSHQSGTDRIAEVVEEIQTDIVINVQADEPEIDPAHIDKVAQLLIDNPDFQMSTLAAPCAAKDEISNPNIVKVIIADSGQRTADSEILNAGRSTLNAGTAIYFSRCPIPYNRERAGIGSPGQYLRHIGIYAYRRDFLLKLTSLPQSPLEKIEKLEQLRAIENGYGILVGIVEKTCDGIDTQQQYAEFVKRYNSRKSLK